MSAPIVPAPAAPQKPSAVPTVFGVVNVGFGAFGLIGLLMGVASLFVTSGMPNPVLDVMRSNAVYHAWTIGQLALNGLASGALVASGIGLFMRREWGRLLALAVAIASLVLLAAGTLMNVFFLIPPLLQRYHEASPGPEQVGALVGMISPICAIPFGLILPALTLFFLTRPEVKAGLI